MADSPPFSAVVVTHNSAAELPELLDSIERELDPPPQVIVVDAASADDTLSAAAGRAEVIALEHNPGFGAACNAGVERADGEVTVLLNPDAVLLDAGLTALAEIARPRAILAVPRLLNPDRTIQRSAHPAPGRMRALLPALVHPRMLPGPLGLAADPWRSEEPRSVGWAVAACVAARTEVLRSLGPFEADQFLFYEDMDLCLRAGAAGIPTELHPEVAVLHAGGHSTTPAYGGEPHELLARRRREVVTARLGPRAAALDDAAQAITFATRALARILLRRDSARERAQLRGFLASRRGKS